MTEHQSASFAHFLSGLRSARGLGVREAARVIGVSHSRLLDFEAGFDQHTGRPCLPSIATLVKIASAYDLDVAEVLERAGYNLPGVPQNAEERQLISSFRALSAEKRQRLVEFLSDLKGRD